MSRRAWILFGASLILLVGGALFFIEHPTLNFPFFFRVFRYEESRSIGNIQWFEPSERVAGNPLPLKIRPIDHPALEEAAAWAEARNSYSFIVSHRGRIVYEKYWRGYGPESLSDSASMAKTVVAIVVGIAIQEKKIRSVEEKVSVFLPEFERISPELRLVDLLQMSSGLAVKGKREEPFSEMGKMIFGTNIKAVLSNIRLDVPPGTRFQYSNFDTQILLSVLEKATGIRYSEYLSTRLWTKLGASDAKVFLDRLEGTAHGFCCLLANARDWVRVGNLLLNKGRLNGERIVSEAWIEALSEPSARSELYGYQVWLGKRSGQLRLQGRNKQSVWVMPDRDLVVVRTGEQPKDWDGSVLPRLARRAIPW